MCALASKEYIDGVFHLCTLLIHEPQKHDVAS